jgi:hypothetical protein
MVLRVGLAAEKPTESDNSVAVAGVGHDRTNEEMTMDGMQFDDLTRVAARASSRRATLGLVAGSALAAALAKFELTDARKGKGKNKKKKKCRKVNQGCGGKKKKCCKGLTCTNGTCVTPGQPECTVDSDCGANEICQNGVCVPEPPECTVNNDCGLNETCQNGECVPNNFECAGDDDCDDNEQCQVGECVCPSVLGGECVVRCDPQTDCPGICTCQATFPGIGQPRVVCVDQTFDFCAGAIGCDQIDECPAGSICAFTTCDSPAGSGRCLPVTCDDD